MKTKLGLIFAAALATQCVTALAQNNGTTAAPAESAPAANVTSTNAPGDEIMPLIVIDEAPLPDAIRNLARQAGINIQFDPRVLTSTNAQGQVVPPPNVSFRWENITARQALTAVMENHGFQMVEDPRTHISRVTVKDPQALEPLVPRVISLKYTHPTNVVSVVKASFTGPRSQVLADARTGQLVVIATEKEQVAIEELITKLDVSPAQILIEARFIETFKNPRSAKGVNWTPTLEANRLTFGNNPFTFREGGDIGSPIPPGNDGHNNGANLPNFSTFPSRISINTISGFGNIPGYLNSDGLEAVLSFINQDAESEVVATPRAVALEGVATELSVVRNIPVFEEQQGANAGGAVQNAVKPNYNINVNGTVLNEVGTKLFVTPKIFGDTNIFLDLRPEISEQEATPQRTVLGGRVNEAPKFLRRKIQTQAMVPSAHTIVIGGLREDRHSKSASKVPLLGDAPGVGALFRQKSKSRDKRDLLIFVTPTILSASDYIASDESREFMHQKPVDRPNAPLSAWDSSDPKDWTKPE